MVELVPKTTTRTCHRFFQNCFRCWEQGIGVVAMKTAFTYPRKHEFIYLLPLIGGMARITAVKKLKIPEVGLTLTTKETILEDIILLVSSNEY